MASDPRFLADAGREVFGGNELLVKGCLETPGGVGLMTGYPGSPVAGFFDTLGALSGVLQEKGVRAFQANNEALSVAAVNGSQMMPIRAVATFKSVGVHVAADALALGNMAGAHPDGGAVIICGEDPWCDSTQVPADSRFLCEHLRMPVVEPGGPQELKDWVAKSFALSRAAGLYVGYIVTTAQADGGGTVDLRPNHWPTLNTNARINLDTAKVDLNKVLLPPRTWRQELKTDDRFRATMDAAREVGINQIIPTRDNGQGTTDASPLGFITTGMARPYLEQVLADLGLAGVFPILNLGLSYPADVRLVREFAETCGDLIVIEERRSFLEKNIRDGLFREFDHDVAAELSGRLYGKRFPQAATPRGTGVPPASANGTSANGKHEERGRDARATRAATRTDADQNARPGIPDTRGLNPSVLAQLLIPLIKGIEALPAELRNGRLTEEMNLIKRTGKRTLEVIGVVKSASPCEAASGDEPLALRTPTFCPGCPHRDSSSTLLELRKNLADADYMKRKWKRPPVDLVAHGDTGCYTMLMFAPTEQLMHNYSGMGLGGGTGSGVDPFITNKQIVFLGDGTFFHSGQIGISNAIAAGQDITFIILENKTTAMTGHQEHPGTEIDLLGNRSFIQDIEAAVRGMKGTSGLTVQKINPADRTKWYKTLEKTILADGVKVLIADKECGITLYRRKGREERETAKKFGYLPKKTHMNVTPEVCENCLECTKGTACPGLVKIETDYGPKIDTDLTWCVNDGACERVRVSNEAGTTVKPCPSFEQVTVVRKKRKRYTLPPMGLSKLPDPVPVRRPGAGEAWRVHLAGVGGMGIGVAGGILVKAGHREGFRVVFSEKKGLAIRNGGVYAQITWVNDRTPSGVGVPPTSPAAVPAASANGSHQQVLGQELGRDAQATRGRDARATEEAAPLPTTGQIPYGKADLVLGVDILEAARAVDPREPFRVATPERTAAVLNLHKQPTVYTLLGTDDFDPEKLKTRILDRCDVEHSYAKDLTDICQTRLGSSQFVNIMMLGVAYQLGLLPVSASAIGRAIKDVIRRDRRRNIKAFNIGRKLALQPTVLPQRPEPRTWEQLLVNKAKILRKTRLAGRTWATRLENLTNGAIKAMPNLPAEAKYDLALRIYDLLQYDDHRLAKRYVEQVRDLYRRDSADQKYAATRAFLANLAKVTLVKDEPYVAYLLTRHEKRVRDDAKYLVDRANGDTLKYRHHTSPEFPIGKRRLRLRITTTDWQLKLVAKQKWLRRLPGWHRRETEFRDWYAALPARLGRSLDLSTAPGYRAAVEILSCPEPVTGYREVRYPKQEAARSEAEARLSRPPSPTPPTPPRPEVTIHRAAKPKPRVAVEV